MQSLEQNLTQYAAYHRDRRNIATHFIGVPMIMFVLGIAMPVVLFVMCATASEIVARVSTGAALGLAVAVFVVGWALQFLGHKFEGMKPAFFDDAKQLFIGPIFVCAEAFFMLGAKPRLRRYIEERVGPTLARRDGAPISGDVARR
jgi:uncharacterized membrane protein YGL010W